MVAEPEEQDADVVQAHLHPNEYQLRAMHNIMKSAPTYKDRVTLGALGLTREASETAEIVERWLFFEKPLDTAKLEDELGDTLWYAALLCHTVGLTLEEVMLRNLAKLEARYGPDGYTHEAWVADRRRRGVE